MDALRIADLTGPQRTFALDVQADYALRTADDHFIRIYRETPKRTTRWILSSDGVLVDETTFDTAGPRRQSQPSDCR